MAGIRRLLEKHWALQDVAVTPHGGGMNSDTWLVVSEGVSYVAKQVPADAVADLAAGCEASTMLARHGLMTGPPVPTVDGRLLLTEDGLVLLDCVPGRELDGDTDDEQRFIAEVLAAVHLKGAPARGPNSSEFMTEWVALDLPGVSVYPWLSEGITAVRAETDPLQLTWSVLHTDPAPEAFIHDEATGITGLIDWSGARRGPVLYDVASAVMYLGGPANAAMFLSVYSEAGPLEEDELAHLDAFRRFREVVQGTYFARRIATGDHTGGTSDDENLEGLDGAHRRLEAMSRI